MTWGRWEETAWGSGSIDSDRLHYDGALGGPTGEFAILLDASTLVPEPAVATMGGAAAMAALIRRRRCDADSQN
jgi:hypothetical protein